MGDTLEERLMLLNMCLEDDALSCFIKGIAGDLGVKGESYTSAINPYGCLEAIYEKYKTDPNIHLDQKFHDAILENFDINERRTPYIQNTLEVLLYHIYFEKKGKAPFKIETKDLFSAFKANLINNKDHYDSLNSSLDDGERTYSQYIADRDKYEYEANGIKIL